MNKVLVKVTVSHLRLIFGTMRSLSTVLMVKLILNMMTKTRRTVKRTVLDPMDVKRVGFVSMKRKWVKNTEHSRKMGNC